MNNLEFIREFASGKKSGKYSHLEVIGNLLYNYDTIIAERVEGGISLNTRKYSRTTTNIQNLIRRNTNVVAEFEGAPVRYWWY